MKKFRLSLIISTVASAAVFCTGCEPGDDPTLLNIKVTTPPETLIYSPGDKFDPTGMVITGTYIGGREVEVKGYTYEPKDELEMGVEYITISYFGKSCQQQITVSDSPRTQTGIEVTTLPTKLVYEVGDKFDPTGMVVKKVYTDGTGASVLNYTYSPNGELEETDSKIKITSGRFSTYVDITVVPEGAELTGIEIESQPTKTTYYVGDTFDKTGMVVNAIYDGSYKVETKNYTVSPSVMAKDTTEVTISFNGKTATVDVEVKEKQDDPYYEGINPDSSTLLKDLNSLNGRKRKTTVGYKAMLNNPSKGFYITDPGTGSNTITTFYSGRNNNGTSGLNREHVWPDSRGGNQVENDIHMPRPTLTSENGSRGNSFYVEGKCKSSGGWDPAMEDFGLESYRGDSARIIFYCAIASTTLKLVDKEDDSTGNKTMGKLSDLLRWNLKYPVLEREMVRNDGAESLQGNRNPFIDHPEYACKIWGATNSTTRQICGM